MTEFEIKDFKHTRENRGLITADMQDITTANVHFPDHGWIGVSRWHDEDHWVVDCRFGENGYPFFAHGTGSRCVAVSVLAEDHDVTRTLNAMLEVSRS